MSSTTDILIFGATGVIGKFITEKILAAKESFGKVAIFTSQSTVESKKELLEKWKKQGLEVIVGDMAKDEQILKAYESKSCI